MSPLRIAQAASSDIEAANERADQLRDALIDIARRVMPRECRLCGDLVSQVAPAASAVDGKLLPYCVPCARRLYASQR